VGVQIERVDLEAGVSSAWLARGLLAMGLPVIVIDATHAAGALKTGFRDKTDRNDARGIADLMRVNKFRRVWVKSPAAQRDRALRIIAARAKASVSCRRLMTVPGVGPLVTLTFVSGVDQPERFRNAPAVGAHFGLTPRRHQSGEMDWSGRISRAGDAAVRRALYQAANVLLHHSKKWCALKSWAVRLAKRRGLAKAKVALARKLAVVPHKLCTAGEDYRLKAAVA
jgi:transposase